ncbi:decarboxylating NADP(+)-dependent phosphogluconate dehydrogenase [Oceanobacillus caeni]|uniref:decarboxylating NADP(+)-dependent phosphogluconate dehydrogenase n=1 Tax=Oceanobacillus caeni TaxID=405946 RepID=UPI001C248B81|nr:decarboxylating NADP(+)-dependent phosphogluconate dehydrogenase [Oceanobacillus caeni]MBU8791515.1 decarboxylating NADP(+)-dependent phosphogluconate dehydrogenase [Oceanobacillus caeni]MED4473576.1 decarboxylating NADP(+)-dependent phosphogluconate dehydrogenase [Oceanobacillus caeni]
MKNTIGLYGLGVMGASLARNMANKGEQVAIYNYTPDLTDKFENEFPDYDIEAHYELEEFVRSLETPRKIFLMVTAGPIVDSVIQSLVPLLDKGDIIMDGGNSDFHDSNRRYEELHKQGIHFIGVGVSGGEEGALNGPALMPSGDPEAYQQVAPILEKIAAQVDGKPCCTYIGPKGSGHYVKMVHNGIEYADMQLITEAYQFLREIVGLSVQEISEVFTSWNETELKSYLIEITADILTRKDEETGNPLVDVILDKAGQKGTGKWTGQEALDLGVPSTIMTEAVFTRYLSSMKEEKVYASERLVGPQVAEAGLDKEYWIDVVKEALYMGKICAYAQGFYQYRMASSQYGWSLNLGEIALIFRGGCIIRADFLNTISDVFKENPELSNILLAPYFVERASRHQASLRKIVMKGFEAGLSLPCLTTSLTYYDGYRSASSAANLIQAQRDYFGAHTYERIDKEGIFHTNWQN